MLSVREQAQQISQVLGPNGAPRGSALSTEFSVLPGVSCACAPSSSVTLLITQDLPSNPPNPSLLHDLIAHVMDMETERTEMLPSGEE